MSVRDWLIVSPLLISGWYVFVRLTVETVLEGIRANRKRVEIRDTTDTQEPG